LRQEALRGAREVRGRRGDGSGLIWVAFSAFRCSGAFHLLDSHPPPTNNWEDWDSGIPPLPDMAETLSQMSSGALEKNSYVRIPSAVDWRGLEGPKSAVIPPNRPPDGSKCFIENHTREAPLRGRPAPCRGRESHPVRRSVLL